MLTEVRQRELLHAMGIEVYVLRCGSGSGDRADAAAAVDVVVLCGEGPAGDPQARTLRTCLPLVLGVGKDRIQWLRSRADGVVPELPPARACLVMGSDLADTFRAQNSLKPHDTMLIAVADTPAQSLCTSLARKGLWETLKPLRRHLSVAGD